MSYTNHQFIDSSPQRNASGKSMLARYYLPAAHIDDLPDRGDAADTSVAPSGWVVESAVADPLSPYSYRASIVFVASLNSRSARRITRTAPRWNDVKDATELRVGYGDVLITPDMLGLAPIETTDGEPLTDVSRWGVAMEWSPGAFYTAAELVALWTTGNAAKFTYPLSFANSPDLVNLDRPIQTFTFDYTYYTDTTAVLGQFRGVSPGNDIPEDCNVPLRTTAGAWMAVNQDVTRLIDDAGKTYYRVVRTGQMAPVGQVWDSSKNQGEWSWA